MRYRILISDDEVDIVEMLTGFFRSKGYEVFSAYNGVETLKLAELQPDIILLDINMPKLDGMEVCKKIRDYVSCPILFLTARIEENDKVQGFSVGGDDYIVKPFSLVELEARVQAHLRREERHVLDHTFPEFKPFFNERLSKTALYLLENYGSAEKMARMNSVSYEKLRSISRGKFSPQQFIALKELASNTVGVNNSIFDVELNSLLTLYKTLVTEINTLEKEINLLIEEVHPHYLSVPGIGPISAAIIYSEYGDISNFDNPGQMLAFAGIEPGINESGTESHGGRMVKRGSSQLRYALINCCLPLIRFDMTFATYYAKKRAEGKPHRVAITHVAKKLIRVIYALERQDTDFCVQKLR